MRQKLEPIFQEAMERKGVLPVRSNNKKTLKWLENHGCVTRYNLHGRAYFHPEIKGDLQQILRTRDCFRIWGEKDNGSRSHLGGGTMVEIELKRPKVFAARKEFLTVWIPKDLADRILVLGCFP